jgi:hypothetical protein
MPKRVISHHQAAVGQLPEQSSQCEIRLLGDPRQNSNPFRAPQDRAWPAHRQRRRTADGAAALRPLHDAGDADHERLGYRAARLARSHRRNHPLPQVQRIGARCILASNPARCLVAAFDGASLSSDSKDALWARFYMGAPQRQRRSVERYSIVMSGRRSQIKGSAP